MTQLPNYLRAHRKATGLSQRDVARLLGGGNGSKVSGYEHFSRTPSGSGPNPCTTYASSDSGVNTLSGGLAA